MNEIQHACLQSTLCIWPFPCNNVLIRLFSRKLSRCWRWKLCFGNKMVCCSQIRPCHRRRQEAPQVQARYRGPPWDPSLPEEHRAPHPQAALPTSGPWNRPGLQDRSPFPVLCRHGPSGGIRGLPRRSLRRHQPVRHPRQACHHHAQGHPAGPPYPWRVRLSCS